MPDLEDLMREGLSLSEAIRIANAIADFTPEEIPVWREVVREYKQRRANRFSQAIS